MLPSVADVRSMTHIIAAPRRCRPHHLIPLLPQHPSMPLSPSIRNLIHSFSRYYNLRSVSCPPPRPSRSRTPCHGGLPRFPPHHRCRPTQRWSGEKLRDLARGVLLRGADPGRVLLVLIGGLRREPLPARVLAVFAPVPALWLDAVRVAAGGPRLAGRLLRRLSDSA